MNLLKTISIFQIDLIIKKAKYQLKLKILQINNKKKILIIWKNNMINKFKFKLTNSWIQTKI